MQTSLITRTVNAPVCATLALKTVSGDLASNPFPENSTTPCLSQDTACSQSARSHPLTKRVLGTKPQASLVCTANLKLDLHQVLGFLKRKVRIQDSVRLYLEDLQQKASTPVDFIFTVLNGHTTPVPAWFSEKYAQFCVKQADGEAHLWSVAHHENIDRSLRVACALQLSFEKILGADKLLGSFLLRQDFASHRHFILRNIRDEKLKDRLLVCLIQDQKEQHFFANVFRVSYIQALKDPALRSDMAFSFIMDHFHGSSAQLSKAAAFIEDEDLRKKVLETLETGVDFRGAEKIKNASKI